MAPNRVSLNRLHAARHQDTVKLHLLHHYDLKLRKSGKHSLCPRIKFQDEQKDRAWVLVKIVGFEVLNNLVHGVIHHREDIQIPQAFNSNVDQPLLFEIEVKLSELTLNEKNFIVEQIITGKKILAHSTTESTTTQESVKSKACKSMNEQVDVSPCKNNTKDDAFKYQETDANPSTSSIKMKISVQKEIQSECRDSERVKHVYRLT
ncbi:hypothetical protein DM860_007363 [Cuscuta australis]|uniref:Uncharacterized protein n=1 Tax=Cuscuta australis TaxID=267555 RepID=A0A328E4X3_9ASTE|nr:hypothetical protein DM860_007363 [Cuscuta australis]